MDKPTQASSLDGEQIDAIAEEFASRLREGHDVSVDAFVERYCGVERADCDGTSPAEDASVSSSAEQLREVLSGVEVLERMKHAGQPQAAPDTDRLSKLTDYTIVREIGRGGMGIVYEAVHKSLHRKVAIKVLSAARLADNRHLARFQTEARAAARLRHPSIVPVFGVGKLESSQQDTHYYVMDYIAGESLAERLASDRMSGVGSSDSPGAPKRVTQVAAGTPTVQVSSGSVISKTNRESDFELSDDSEARRYQAATTANNTAIGVSQRSRWAAEIGAKIAGALHYAHGQGVLHRDIKPGNFILDEKGHIWLADFGLAKLSEPTTLTQTGDIIGTPQYMPPEALAGHYDKQSEIFALGLTLYECIMLRPAYSGETTSEILQQASSANIQPLRRTNKHVHRDLETILLKCLHKEPQGRYATADQVREDLQRFLDGKPVSARRVGPLGKLVRWSRREPIVASLTAASFLLLIGMTLATSYGYWQSQQNLRLEQQSAAQVKNALTEKTTALDAANVAQARAESNLQVALRAFENISDRISAATLESEADLLGEVTDTTAAGVTDEDAAVLESLLSFFDELATTNSTQLLHESAEAAQRAAMIYASLGKLAKSADSYENAAQRFDQLRKQGDSNELRIAHASLLNDFSAVCALRGEAIAAMEAFQSTLSILDSIEEEDRNDASEFQRARAYRLRAAIPDLGGSTSQLRPGRRPVFERIASQSTARADYAIEVASQAINLLKKLHAENIDSRVVSAEMARAHRTRADARVRARDRDAAQEDIAASIEIWEDLLSDDPQSQAIRYELASTLVKARNFGISPFAQAFRAHELTVELLRSAPDLPRYLSLRATSLQSLAQIELRNGKLTAARRHLGEALKIYTKLHLDSPEISAYALKRSAILEAQGDLESRAGNPEAADEMYAEAINELRRSIDSNQSGASLLRIELQRLLRKRDRRDLKN